MICCVMPTYRRMRCVERSLNLFIDQTLTGEDMELIIFNTDKENPVKLDEEFFGKPFVAGEEDRYYVTFNTEVRIFNNDTDYETGLPYKDIGAIRRDALSHAFGEYYICWDDDDIFLPWNNMQCFDNIKDNHRDFWSWKPAHSMSNCCGQGIRIEGNYMEASIISLTEKIREYGYVNHPGGGEHLSWYKAFEDQRKLYIDDTAIPAYSFNWEDPHPIGGHKQSGSINNPHNFNVHKQGCLDIHTQPLTKIDIKSVIQPYLNVLHANIDKYPQRREAYERYVAPYTFPD